MDFTAFHYKDLQDVRNEMDMLGVKLPLSENIDIRNLLHFLSLF
jgi:hypothetical protein